ncbi:hypothetical protein [Leuconostoc mesenteroides]|uniref:hypothetical protein n=1 Tax=Leuconostoc mesenteroides TaxID=1245 RepID=UPI002247B8A6|nr:hypothetical protein [Leuconostoc mesenteroides]MCX2666599.1 hypothetical protein [Leuconostoc mesenteroides subsp. mesenteroides]
MKEKIKQVGIGVCYGLVGGGVGLIILALALKNHNVFGTVADWFGAVGTILAVVVALKQKKQKGILDVIAYCSTKYFPIEVDDPSGIPGKSLHADQVTQFRIILSNMGDANILVTSIKAKFGDDFDYDFVLFKPVVISSGDVKSLLFNGLGSKYGDSADIGVFNSPYPISVFKYIKANKVKLVVTSHDGKTTKWPIKIEEPKKA